MTWRRKPRKLPGAGAAGIDECRGAAARRHGIGVDAERRAAPVDVGMQVDQPRGDDPPRDVDDRHGSRIRNIGLDRRYPPLRKRHIRHLIEIPLRIDDATAFQNQFEHPCSRAALRGIPSIPRVRLLSTAPSRKAK